jgi:PPOX class probable F420-dependent enzyme
VRLGQLGWVVGEVEPATSPALARFVRQKTVLVTSYRQDGRPVDTPVSLAVDGDHAYLRSFEQAGKTRRLRNNPRVEVAPSTARGRPTGPAIGATASRLEGAGSRHAAHLLAAKHPLLHGLLVPLTHRLGRARTGKTVQFKTMKYRPGFPARFGSIQDARAFCQQFFGWYNREHRHAGIAMMTPQAVHHGHAVQLHQARAEVLAAAYAAHPQRFAHKPPAPKPLPTAVWINPPEPT